MSSEDFDSATDTAPPLTMPISVCRKENFLRRLLYVDGMARCGKNMLSPIIASLTNVEIERVEAVYDWVAIMCGLGRMERDAAIALMRMYSDLYLYDGQLGRNMNFRWQDQSSVFRNPGTVRNLRRLLRKEGDDVIDRVLEEAPLFQNLTHHQMEFADLHFDAFPEELKIIEILRDPVDMVETWWRRGNGSRLCTGRKDIGVCLEYGDQSVHYLTLGWEGDYFSMAPIDRVVRMLHGLQMRTREGYEALSADRRARVHWIKFERFVTEPMEHMQMIALFLGADTTRDTARAIRRQNLPISIPESRWESRYKWIKQEGSPLSKRLIDEMIDDYRSDWS